MRELALVLCLKHQLLLNLNEWSKKKTSTIPKIQHEKVHSNDELKIRFVRNRRVISKTELVLKYRK